MEPKRPDEPHELAHGATEGAPPAGDEDAGREIRAAERCAERAAAVAAVEGFHPLRVRPYVIEPDGRAADTTETSVLPVLAAVSEASAAPAAAAAGASATDLGLFPTTCLEYAGDRADAHRPDPGAEAAAIALRGRHRRRKRGIVIAAAAVAASALAAGAVAVTGQVMGDEQSGGMDRALPDLATAVPDVTLPADAGPGLATTADPVVRTAPPSVAAPSTSPSPVTSRGPVTAAHRTRATPPAAPTAPATAAPTTPPQEAPVSPVPTTGQTLAPANSALVLERGDTGPAVADLQRRLSEMSLYHGPIDGTFDRHLQVSLEVFQVWYWVSDATDGSYNGVYGPNTRAALERRTS